MRAVKEKGCPKPPPPPIPDLLKWLVIASTSFVTIMALYEFVVRRVNVLRFLFGMKPLRRSVQLAPTAVPVPQTGEIKTY